MGKNLWNYIGGGLTAAGSVALAPLTGGASLAAMPLAQSMLQAGLNNTSQDRQNKYNSPASQMERYRAAGLNPNLIYGQGNSGNQASPVQYDAPELPKGGIRGVKLAYENQQIQNQILKYQQAAEFHRADQIHYDALLKETKQLGEVTKNQMAIANVPYASDLARYNAQIAASRVSALMKDITIKQAQILNLRLDRDIKSQIFKEKSYLNFLRTYGVEKNDNIFLRGGAQLWQRYAPHFNQKFSH